MKEDEASLARKQEYYERLLAMDVFGEGDYVELARIYGSRGNWEEQRRMLSKVLRLYPSVEYAEQLSAVTVYRDDTEEEMAALADRIREALEQQDVPALRALALSEEWHRLLQEGMEAIETRTHYQAGEDILQIAAGGNLQDILPCRLPPAARLWRSPGAAGRDVSCFTGQTLRRQHWVPRLWRTGHMPEK